MVKLVVKIAIVFTALHSWGFAQQDTTILKQFELKEQHVLSDPFKQTTLDSSSLELFSGQNLSQLLEQETELFIKDYGPGQIATPSFRGTGAAHTQVFWNGITLNAPSLGQFDFSLFPVSTQDNVSIHYGNSTLTDGFGGIGGSILIENGNDIGEKPHLALSQDLGSFGRYTTLLSGSLRKKKWFVQAGVQRAQAENNFEYENTAVSGSPAENRKYNKFERYSGQLTLGYRASPYTTLSLHGLYGNTFRQIPPLITDQISSGEEQTDILSAAVFQLEHKKGKHQLLFNTGGSYSELHFDDTLAAISSTTYGTNVQANVRYNYWVTKKSQLRTAVFYQQESVSTPGYENQQTRNRFAGLIQWRTYFGKRFQVEAFLRPEYTGDSLVFFLPALGMEYKPFKKRSFWIKANVAKNVHFPTLNDLYWVPGGNENLETEVGENVELGLLYTFKPATKNSVSLEATGFYGEVDNWIQWVPNENNWTAQNIKTVNNYGIESKIQLSGKSNKWKYTVKIMHSYTKSIDENNGDVQLIYVPENQFKTRLSVRRQRVGVFIWYQYVDQRFINTTNTSYMPAYDLVHLALDYNFKLAGKHRIGARFTVNNLFDKSYQSIAWKPMPGRNFSLRLTYAFN